MAASTIPSVQKLCKCGCGEEIVLRRHHRWVGVPDFIHGHNGRGRVTPQITKDRIALAHIGKKASPEAREKMKTKALLKWQKEGYREAHTGEGAFRYNSKATSETKEKLRKSMELVLKRPEYIEKQRIAKTKFWQDPANRAKVTKSNLLAWENPERRKRCSEVFLKLWESPEHRKRMSEIRKGEKSPCWRGGRKNYGKDWTADLKDVIRERDGYRCHLCNVSQRDINNKYLDVHHIDYDKTNCDPINLISLCRSCHMKTGSEREKWTKYFTTTTQERISANAV